MTDPVDAWVLATHDALAPLADPERAAPMRAYMKDVAPFLGISTPVRRSALRAAWKGMPPLAAEQVPAVAVALWALPEREFQYAACDLLAREQRRLSSDVLADPVEYLVTSKPWWDTVDSLGTAVISPLTARDATQIPLMQGWCNSEDRWLVRAAIQHQRGRGPQTDVPVLLAMCDQHAEEREFFIAKAIGWALRDLARWNPDAVRRFLLAHPGLSRVAAREAERGLTTGSGH